LLTVILEDYVILYPGYDKSLDAIDDSGDCLALKVNMGHVKPYCMAKKEHTVHKLNDSRHIFHIAEIYIQYPPLEISTTVL